MALFAVKKAAVNIPRLCAGDQEAWRVFVKESTPFIHSVVRNTLVTHLGCANLADVKDVVQDVFLRLIKNNYHLLKAYDSQRAGIATWIARIARCTAIDYCRHSRPAILTLDEGELVVNGDRPSDPIEFPNGLLSAREETILRLLFEKDFSVPEVAAKLGILVQTIYSHKCRGIKKLRDFYVIIGGCAWKEKQKKSER